MDRLSDPVGLPANISEALDAFLALPLDHPLRPSQDYLDYLLNCEASRLTSQHYYPALDDPTGYEY